MLQRLLMIYSIIPAQYVVTAEYCYVQMMACRFFLDKVRNELVKEIDDANTDKEALFYAENINDLTRILTQADKFIEIIDEYINPDLVNILKQRYVWKDTIWYKNVCKTNCGYKIMDICLGQVNILKLQACDILNKDFDLGIECEARTLNGTLTGD